MFEIDIQYIYYMINGGSENMDYQKMYAIVCAAASDAIDLMDRGDTTQARELLARALLRAEEIYLDSGEKVEARD